MGRRQISGNHAQAAKQDPAYFRATHYRAEHIEWEHCRLMRLIRPWRRERRSVMMSTGCECLENVWGLRNARSRWFQSRSSSRSRFNACPLHLYMDTRTLHAQIWRRSLFTEETPLCTKQYSLSLRAHVTPDLLLEKILRRWIIDSRLPGRCWA